MFKKLNLTPVFSLICLFVLFGFAFAQGTTTRVTGTVTDNSGAIIGGANVTLINEGTKATLTTVSDDGGNYTFDLIQPGTYQIAVEKSGFKRFVSTGNQIFINQPGTINAALEIGDVSAVVTVEGSAEQVQTSSSGNIGSTVEQKTLESFPVVGTRGRNPLDLLNYQPGVANGANTGGGVHVNGSRDRAFNFTLDGIDINEATAGGSNFTPLRPNPDSLQEFQVVTSGFTAELGRSSGAQVTFVTKSGTNQFKGNLFEYYQTPRFQARSYAANVNNQAKEQFVQHIYGGSLGGPLFNFGIGEGTPFRFLRDKAFFFTNLQLLRAYDSLISTRTVYTQQARQGLFRYVRGGVNGAAGSANASVDANGNPLRGNCGSPAVTPCIDSYNIANNPTGIGLDPLLLGYINAMPLPNNFTLAGDGLNTAAYVWSAPQKEKQYDFVSKFDFNLNSQNAFYVRYAQGEQNTFGDAANGGRPRYPNSGNFVDTFRTPKNLAINWRFSPTARLTNEFIFGVSQFGFSFNTPNPDPNYSFAFNLPTDSNTNFSYNARSFRTIQYVDNLTMDFSPHIIKTGMNLRFGRGFDDRSSVAGTNIEPVVSLSRTNSVYTGFNLPTAGSTSINNTDLQRLQNAINDLLGRVSTYQQAFVVDENNLNAFAAAGTRWNYVAYYPELDFYVQDNWRFRPNFTIDAGVRYEIKLTPSSGTGRPVLRPSQPFVLGSPVTNALRWEEGDLFPSDYTVILPTVGFAWDPFKDGKTSIRANYRISSDKFGTQFFGASIFQSAPGNTVAGNDNGLSAATGLLLRNGLPTLAPNRTPSALRTPAAFSTNAINVIDPDVQFPRVHSWTLSFQREVFKENVVEVNYIGKKGTHLFGGYDANQVNINASLNNETFLQAFNRVKNGETNVGFFNTLFTGSATNSAGTTIFRNLDSTGIDLGNVATLASLASRRLCQSTDVSTGVCTSAQVSQGARLVDLTGNTFLLQPYPQFAGGLFVTDSNDYSFYNSVEAIFKRRFNKGLSFQFAYTYAISKDTRSFDPVFTTVGTGTTQTAANTPQDIRRRNLIYSWSDFDRRHSFQGTYVYELPFGKGKFIGNDAPSVVSYLISGWQLAGGVRLTSGRPFSVYSGLNTFSNSVGSFANCSGCTRDMGKVIQADPSGAGLLRNWFFDPATQLSMFSRPTPGTLGNLPRNFFIGPRYFETDASLIKNFKFTERFNFDLRVDAKNLFNTPNFNAPSAVFPANGNLSGSLFGRINADVVNSARRIQVSGKLNF